MRRVRSVCRSHAPKLPEANSSCYIRCVSHVLVGIYIYIYMYRQVYNASASLLFCSHSSILYGHCWGLAHYFRQNISFPGITPLLAREQAFSRMMGSTACLLFSSVLRLTSHLSILYCVAVLTNTTKNTTNNAPFFATLASYICMSNITSLAEYYAKYVNICIY